jgi:hypothetical protein
MAAVAVMTHANAASNPLHLDIMVVLPSTLQIEKEGPLSARRPMVLPLKIEGPFGTALC